VTDVGFTHVALEVTDLEASIAFYSAFAGMQVVHRRPRVAWLSDRTRPFVIVLVKAKSVETKLLPLAHLGVACASREEIDRLSEAARREDRLIEGPRDLGPPIGYYVFIRDPDGHTLELSHGQEVGVTVEGAGGGESESSQPG
jgi:catechol 2,3-dioxygenase-like lactoylglutathione lyase family enzyme